MVAHHLKPGAFYKVRDELTDGAFRRLAQKVDMELLARMARADCNGRGGRLRLLRDGLVSRESSRASASNIGRPTPILMGRHLLELGVEPGPRMGEILKAVYELQLDGEVTDLEEGKREAAAVIGASGGRLH